MLRHARRAASPLAHDSAYTSNNNGEWIGLPGSLKGADFDGNAQFVSRAWRFPFQPA
jgi:hypothetical protein